LRHRLPGSRQRLKFAACNPSAIKNTQCFRALMQTVSFASRNCDDLIVINLPVADTKRMANVR
jgi:hypothetical protein